MSAFANEMDGQSQTCTDESKNIFLPKRRDKLADLAGDQRFEIRILIENHIGDDGHHDEMREVIAAALIKTGYV